MSNMDVRKEALAAHRVQARRQDMDMLLYPIVVLMTNWSFSPQ